MAGRARPNVAAYGGVECPRRDDTTSTRRDDARSSCAPACGGPSVAESFMLGGHRRRSPAGQTLARARAAGASRLWPRDLARGVALFFGLFSWLNLVGELRAPGFDQNIWWLDLRPLPAAISAPCWRLRDSCSCGGGCGRRRRRPPRCDGGPPCPQPVAVRNGVGFYRAWQRRAPPRRPAGAGRPSWWPRPRVLCGIVFPLAQQVFFGWPSSAPRSRDGTRPSLFATALDGRAALPAGLADRLLMWGRRAWASR